MGVKKTSKFSEFVRKIKKKTNLKIILLFKVVFNTKTQALLILFGFGKIILKTLIIRLRGGEIIVNSIHR